MNATTSIPVQSPVAAGRGWLWLGAGVGMLAIALNLAQMFALRQLFTPWYLPVVGTIGAACILASFLIRRSLGRVVVLLFFGLLAAFEWYLVVSFTKTPAYAGPVAGEHMPAFQISRADGTPFTDANLKVNQDTILILFRGHW